MQVFVPYPDAHQSLKVLDSLRFNKQIVEANQIIDTIIRKRQGETKIAWENHPAVLMWENALDSLKLYINAAMYIKYNGNVPAHLRYIRVQDHITKPPMWGDYDFHRSHQSRLLFKGKIDLLRYAVTKYLGNSRLAKQWRIVEGFPEWSKFSQLDYRRAQYILSKKGIEIKEQDNHYLQFFPDVPDYLPYIWPVQKSS